MTDYFFGGEMDAFTPSDGAVYEVALVGSFDPVFADCAIRAGAVFGNTTSYVEWNHAAVSTFYSLRFDLYLVQGQADTAEYELLPLYNSSGTKVFKLTHSGNGALTGGVIRSYSWNGSAFVQVGVGFSYTVTSRPAVVINLTPATGVYKIYMNGALRDSGTATAFTNIAKGQGRSVYIPTSWSQVRVADYSLVGSNLKTIRPDTAGTNTAWTGGAAQINELVYSDASYISSTANGDIETYTKAILDLSPYSIQGFGVSARANSGVSGPQNLQLALRVSGTNYFSSSILQSVGYAVSQHIWATNPATSAAWDPAVAQVAEFGVKAIT